MVIFRKALRKAEIKTKKKFCNTSNKAKRTKCLNRVIKYTESKMEKNLIHISSKITTKYLNYFILILFASGLCMITYKDTNSKTWQS